MIDDSKLILSLEARVEKLEHEREELQIAIAEACEHLGHEGKTPVDLLDAVSGLERLIDGKDIDPGQDRHGLAGKVQALVLGRQSVAMVWPAAGRG